MGMGRALVAVLLAGGLGAAEPLVGHWFWVDHQTLAFGSGGLAQAWQGGQRLKQGRWTLQDAAKGRYGVRWGSAAAETLEVSADGWTLLGTTPEGVPRRGERLDDADTVGP